MMNLVWRSVSVRFCEQLTVPGLIRVVYQGRAQYQETHPQSLALYFE